VTGRIAAVLDWELCTLGDPLADIGYIGVSWSDEGSVPRRATDPTVAGGFPLYAELLERYAMRTGRDLSEIEYYRAFAAFRLAVISEGVYARYLHGVMADEDVDLNMFKTNVEDLAAGALQALREL
jgi:aminoglycoside phosphotransferase (APT) family kinase protein